MEILNSNEFGVIDLDDLNKFETHNQISLPEDYKSFLLKHNGGVPEPNIVSHGSFKTNVQIFFGMHDGSYYANFRQHLDMFQNRIPSWYIPIAGDSGGNLFIMSVWDGNKGVIAFWDHENETPEGEADQYFDNMYKVADSFTEFVSNLTDNALK